jgi:hypothetical protein
MGGSGGNGLPRGSATPANASVLLESYGGAITLSNSSITASGGRAAMGNMATVATAATPKRRLLGHTVFRGKQHQHYRRQFDQRQRRQWRYSGLRHGRYCRQQRGIAVAASGVSMSGSSISANGGSGGSAGCGVAGSDALPAAPATVV